MRFRAAPSALALALAVTLGVPSGGAAAPSYAEPGLPELPSQASDRAKEALATARGVLAGLDDSLEPSTALRELFLLRDQLQGRERAQADRILARPDGESPGGNVEDGTSLSWTLLDRRADPVCNGRICVHYVTTGANAATYAQAKATLDATTRSWNIEVGRLGFWAPRKDGTRGDRSTAASKGKLDVYLADLSRMGAFGYAVPEPEPSATDDGRPDTATGYLVLDQDFAGYGPRPGAYRKVTAAHELFHVIQYGYRVMGEEGRWFMESTATWVEERVYDGINDNRDYLRYGQLGRPRDSLRLTNGGAEYGNWLLHEFYTQRKGDVLVQRAWYQVSRGRSWHAAVHAALRSARWSWPAMYTDYAANNNYPARTYSEGRAYRGVAATPLGRRADGASRVALKPYSSVTYQFRPQARPLYTTGPQLTLRVDLASGNKHRAYVIVHLTDGRLRRYLIPVDGSGAGARTFPFRRAAVRHVNMTLVNASAAGNVPAAYTASTR